jgi:hypothetical protein
LLAGFKAVSQGTNPTNLNRGWEGTNIRGHTMGHWLSAVAHAYPKTKGSDATLASQIKTTLDDVVAKVKTYQLASRFRAGALTLAELAIVGKPAMLVPLPTAADDHQGKNAVCFAEMGAAVVLDQRKCSAEDLHAAVDALARDREKRVAMGKAMHKLAHSRPSVQANPIAAQWENLHGACKLRG